MDPAFSTSPAGTEYFHPQPYFNFDVKGGPCPYPFVTSSSGLPCPLSRYRTELQTCSAIEKMRPVDGQRLPSAHPAALTAGLKKDWLPPPFTDPPAIIFFPPVPKEKTLLEKMVFHSATRVSHPSYTPFSGFHWKPARQSSRKGPMTRFRPLSCGHHPAAFRVIPSFREGVY